MTWRRAPLGTVVADVRSGFPSGEDVPDGLFQFRMNNVRADGGLDLSKKRRVPVPKGGLAGLLLEPGDVLFNSTNSPELVGKTAYFAGLDEPATFSNHFLRLRPAGVEGRYLARWLTYEFQRGAFLSITRQWVNQAAIDKAGLLNCLVPLPPLAEQRRIADIIDAADGLRAKRRLALVRLGALAHSIFCEMFGDPVSNSKRWADSSRLGDIADIVSGVTKGRKLNGGRPREVPYLAVVNVQDGRLDLAKVKTIEAIESEINRYRLEKGDLLLTEGGDPDKLGRGCLWAGELPECIHQNHIFRVRVRDSRVTPSFLSWLIGSQRGKRYFLKSAKQTTGIASINLGQLRAFPLLVPPLELQHQFGAAVDRLSEVEGHLKMSMQRLDDMFASVQHRVFRAEP